MGIVTHANTFYTGLGKLLFDAEECILAGILRHVKQLVLDAQELVVLRHTVGAARRAGLDLAGIDGDHLLQAVDVAVEMNKNGDYGTPVPDYTDENVSDKVVKIIQSYTGVVNKMVWRKF